MRSRRGIAAGIATVAGLVAWLAVPTPLPAMAPSGRVGVVPGTLDAGASGATLTFTYVANTAFAGQVSLGVPAGFDAPQTAQQQGPGFVSAAGGSCARATVTAGGGAVQLTLRCSPGATAAFRLLVDTVPQSPGSYGFATTATPVGSSAAGPLATPAVSVIAPSAISTHASPTGAVSGVTIGASDSAVVSGVDGAVPTGSLSFTLYGDAACTVPVLGPFQVALSPATSSSATGSVYDTWTPQTPGPYHWVASYAGDPDYAPSASPCGAADQEVDVAGPDVSAGISAEASPQSATAGTPLSIGDSATVGGLDGLPPSGTVSFALYRDGQCTDPVSGVSSTVPLSAMSSGSSAASYLTTWTPPAPGTYSWGVVYSGDADYPPASVCGGPGNTVTVG